MAEKMFIIFHIYFPAAFVGFWRQVANLLQLIRLSLLNSLTAFLAEYNCFRTKLIIKPVESTIAKEINFFIAHTVAQLNKKIEFYSIIYQIFCFRFWKSFAEGKMRKKWFKSCYQKHLENVVRAIDFSLLHNRTWLNTCSSEKMVAVVLSFFLKKKTLK